MAWVKIGNRKFGIEAAYLIGSAFFMYLVQTYTIKPQGWESTLFYTVFFYNVIAYISLVLSDPGRITDLSYRKQIDELVSSTHSSYHFVVQIPAGEVTKAKRVLSDCDQ